MSWKEFFKQYKIAFIGSLGMVPVFLAIGLLLYFPDTEKTERGKVEQQTVGTKKEAENLSPFVKGMKDLYVEQNAKDVDWLKGVTYDKEKVKEVTADSKEVKLDKTGTYGLVYKITGKENGESEKKSVKVMVVDSKKSQELANSGEEVLLSRNELKKAEKPEGEKETEVASEKDKEEEKKAEENKEGKKSEGQVDSSSSSETTAGVQDNKSPSGGNVASGGNQQDSGASGVQKPSVQVPEQPSKPEQKPSDTTDQKPAEPSRPEEPEKQWHEPVYENRWVVDREAWDEVIEEPVYEMVEHTICSSCGADISGWAVQHLEESLDCGGYYSEWRQEQTGTTSHTVHHEEQGHYEPVLVKEGYWG